jgi:hypothetical protein
MLTVRTSIYNNSPKIIWIETKPTDVQIKIMEKLNLSLEQDDTFLTAVAKIEDAVAQAIGDTRVLQPTEKQFEICSTIGIDISCNSRRVAWAKIKQKIQLMNYQANTAAIKAMHLKIGDTVSEKSTFTMPNGRVLESEKQGIVTFIRWDGSVSFRDVNQRLVKSWAQKLTKLGLKTKHKR